MNNFKVDWNDHIGEFIRLKATQPHVLSEMLKREQHHSHQKEVQRRIRRLKSQHGELQAQLSQEISKLKEVQGNNTAIRAQIHQLEDNCASIQWQLNRNSKQLQKRHKTKSSRSSLDGTNHTNSESSLVFMKKDLAKKVNYDLLKQQMQAQVQKIIAHKISLKEEMEKVTVRICNIQEAAKKNIKAETLKEEIRKFRVKEQKLRNDKLALTEKHRQRQVESQKPAKFDKLMDALVKENSKRLQAFIKQAKRLVLSEKTRTSKRYKELNKYNRLKDQAQAQRQFDTLLKKYPDLGVSYCQGVGAYEEIEKQMFALLVKKEVNPNGCKQLEDELQKIGLEISQLQAAETLLNIQIEDYRQDLQKKKACIRRST